MNLSVTVLSGIASGTTLEIVIWSLFAGICLGILFGIYIKVLLGSFVRRLLAKDANSPITAQTLDSSGLTHNPAVRFAVCNALRDGSSYRKIVHMSAPSDPLSQIQSEQNSPSGEKVKGPKKSSINFADARFFIPDEFSFRASQIYDNRGNSVLFALISILAFLLVAFLSFYIVPELIGMIESLIG